MRDALPGYQSTVLKRCYCYRYCHCHCHCHCHCYCNRYCYCYYCCYCNCYCHYYCCCCCVTITVTVTITVAVTVSLLLLLSLITYEHCGCLVCVKKGVCSLEILLCRIWSERGLHHRGPDLIPSIVTLTALLSNAHQMLWILEGHQHA